MAEGDDTRVPRPRRGSSTGQPPPGRSVGARLRAEINGTRLALDGYIDETSTLPDIVTVLSFPLHIDLEKIQRVNSVGVRSWIEFIQRAVELGPVSLWRCPDVLVHQFGMVSSMLGSAQVCSVLAPYVCERCGHLDRKELRIPEDIDPGAPELAPPAISCTRCGGNSVFDDVADSFFMFLNRRS